MTPRAPHVILRLLAAASILLLVPQGGAQAEGSPDPQQDWMVHMDGSGGSWKFVPERIVLVPGGLVQLMVFGNGQFSLTLDAPEGYDADISSTEGVVRTAELHAPAEVGEYAFHDKYHPEARGVLVVAQPPAAVSPAVIGVVPGGYESRFAPERLEVDAGAEVIFRANGTFGHNLRAVDGSFDAGDLKPGEEARFVAPSAPGEHAFECRFHAEQGMRGILVVRSASSPVAASEGPAETSAGEAKPTPLVPVLAIAALALALLLRGARR